MPLASTETMNHFSFNSSENTNAQLRSAAILCTFDPWDLFSHNYSHTYSVDGSMYQSEKTSQLQFVIIIFCHSSIKPHLFTISSSTNKDIERLSEFIVFS